MASALPHVRLELSAAIRVRHLQTPIADALSFDEGDSLAAAAARLEQMAFDAAPVRKGGRVLAYVTRVTAAAHGSGRVGEVAVPLGVGDFVPSESTVSDLLRAFDGPLILFALCGRDITGLVTPSDLNKQAAKAHFYLLASEVEIGLSAALRARYRDQDAALDALSPKRAADVRQRYERDKGLDIEADLVAEFELADLFEATAASPEILERLDASGRQLSILGWKVVELRNDVVHPTRQLVHLTRGPTDLLRLEGRMEALLDRLGRLPARIRRARRPSLAAGPTPQQLAIEIGHPNGKRVRAYLRAAHPRPRSLKWTRWEPLTRAVAANVRRHFATMDGR